jgi:two-component system sensor histidine kinase PilS (NtrC family)
MVAAGQANVEELAVPPLVSEAESLKRKLGWTVFARLAVFTFLGSATVLFGVESFHPYSPVETVDIVLFGTAGIGCFLCLILAFALRLARSHYVLLWLTYSQLLGDVLCATVLVFITGGTSSSFVFFFSLVIIEGAVLTYKPGAFITATACTLLLVSIGLLELGLVGEQTEIVESVSLDVKADDLQSHTALWGGLAYRLLNNVVAFYSIAFMASLLAERARSSARQLELSRHSLADLKVVHESIIGSIPSGLITLDQNARIDFFNRRAWLITGRSPDDVLGSAFLKVFPEASDVMDATTTSEDSNLDTPVRTSIQRPGGFIADLEWRISPLKDARDRIQGHLIVLQDVTLVSQMEQKIKRSERYATIGKLAASIAHEIRNPLTSIAGSIQLLSQMGEREADEQRLMKIVHRETESLNQWITDFLTYSRQLPEEQAPIDLGKVINEVLQALTMNEQSKGIEIEISLKEGLQVMADISSVKQIFWNVLLNAVQAMEKGGKLWVEMEHQKEDGLVQIRVTDTGKGIDSEHSDQVFEPFYTTKESGTGLGLATVYRLVSELGGTIQFHSLLGEGTTFYIGLPAYEEQAIEVDPPVSPPVSPPVGILA